LLALSEPVHSESSKPGMQLAPKLLPVLQVSTVPASALSAMQTACPGTSAAQSLPCVQTCPSASQGTHLLVASQLRPTLHVLVVPENLTQSALAAPNAWQVALACVPAR